MRLDNNEREEIVRQLKDNSQSDQMIAMTLIYSDGTTQLRDATNTRPNVVFFIIIIISVRL